MERIQRKRTVGWRMPDGTKYIGRPSIWANPFKVGEPPPKRFIQFEFHFEDTIKYKNNAVVKDAAEAVRLYEMYSPPSLPELEMLKGKNIACWCKVNDHCHGDVIIKHYNKYIKNEKG